ncbi:tetratricopeptide repeat protein [Streptomyces sp. NPDC049881]|uniref:AfsR/SARP family transcriptional regulator n=1 Tax=Streptomyces sp. NPDC049881 TaxID=3155778 RepID=UPI0034169A61
MEFQISLLGPVEARVDGRLCDLGSRQQKLVLAALAWDAGRTVSRQTLIRRVWADESPGHAAASLSSYCSRIRGALGAEARDRLTWTSGGYHLDIHPDMVDARRQMTLTDQARALADNGSVEAAFALLRDVQALRRGEVLAGLEGRWVDEIRAHFDEQEILSVLLEASITLRLGRYNETVLRLQPLVDDMPEDESLVAHLSLGLHGAGRSTQALLLLQRTAQHLIHEYGNDLGARLREIRRGIHEDVPATDLLVHIGVSDAPRPPDLIPENLPRGTQLVGRRDELRYFDTVVGRLHDTLPSAVALTAIEGTGGAGKTVLALQVGHQLHDRFPDGRIFLRLLGHDPAQPALPPEAALRELLRLIGVPEAASTFTVDQLAALWRKEMSRRRALVILDDALDADQVEPLLPGASPSFVIITSRRRLAGLSGVRSILLDALPEEEAIALFQRRLAEDRAGDRKEVARIVRLCSYLPLAIDIAACRLLTRPAWTPADLADRLAEAPTGRLDELRDGTRGLVDVFSMSYRTLSADQRRFFRTVGLYPGSDFSPHAAAALTGLTLGATEHLLEELLHVNLCMELSKDRFSVHDLLREYARTLASPGEASAAVLRLTETVIQAADMADRRAYPHRLRADVSEDSSAWARSSATRWLEAAGHQQWFTAEGGNLLALLGYLRAYGPARSHALLTHALAGFLENEGYLLTALPHLRKAVGHWAATGEPVLHTRALLDLSTVCTRVGDYEEALKAAGEALEIARGTGDVDAETTVLLHTGALQWHTGHFQEAVALQRHALRICQRQSDERQVARTLNLLGICLLHLGRWREAHDHFRHAILIFEAMEDRRGLYRTLHNLAELQVRSGRPHEALATCQQALGVARSAASLPELALLRTAMARILTLLGETTKALGLYRDALPVIRSAGDLLHESVVLNELGISLRVAGRAGEAMPHHVTALTLARGIHAPNEELQALRELAHTEHLTGRHAQACVHAEEALTIARRLLSPDEVAKSLALLARLEGHMGRTQVAEELRHEAHTIESHLLDEVRQLP